MHCFLTVVKVFIMINYQTLSYSGIFQIIRNRHYSPDVLPIKNLPIPTVYGKRIDATPFSS